MNGNGGDLQHVNHRIIYGTVEGEFAAMVHITDLRADDSPIIVEEIEDRLTRDLGHLILSRSTTIVQG